MPLIDDILGGGVAKLVQTVVGTFKLSPEAKAEMDKQLEEHKFELAKMDLDLESKLADIASQNIQAEEKSGDKYTSRARPTFLYMMDLILFCNFVLFPAIKRPPIQFPDALFWLFGSVMLGYVGARSWEKISGVMGGK